MAFDPLYTSSPSDSGLLDGLPSGYPGLPNGPGAVPLRDEYVAPVPVPFDPSAPEEALRDALLPDGFMARLRSFVADL